MKCGRCNKETDNFTGSFFDMEMICIDCNKIEKAHPLYEEAKRIEHEQVVKGNYNYEGIGLPSDFAEFAKKMVQR